MQNSEVTTMVIRPCGCDSVFQDKLYGIHARAHNYVSGNGTRSGDARCTVCSAVHGPVVKAAPAVSTDVVSTDTKTSGISRMGGRKSGLKGKKGKGKKQG